MTLLNGAFGALLPLAIFALAFRSGSPMLGAFGALASIPFCAFAAGYPLFGWIGWLALAGNFVAAACLTLRKDVALTALTPFLAICLFLCVLSLRGIRLWHP